VITIARHHPFSPQVPLAIVIALALSSGCVATPLPTPPTYDVQRMTLVQSEAPDAVDVRGAPGAIGGLPPIVRVSGPRAWAESSVAGDASFEIRELTGALAETFYLEAVLDDRDVFLVAFTDGPGDSITPVDPGPDADGDGSPDAIDCAPDDPMVGGRRCTTECVDEICANGVDDDCDGAIDEECVDGDGDGILPPEDCDDTDETVYPGAPEACDGIDDDCDRVADNGCVVECVSDMDCAPALACVSGVCTCGAPPLMECAGACVDTDTDELHCGDCYVPCTTGQSCERGRCTP
jgi:hypothetical protein